MRCSPLFGRFVFTTLLFKKITSKAHLVPVLEISSQDSRNEKLVVEI